MKVTLKRVDQGFHFEGLGTSKVPIHIDGSKEIGGNNSGARPMANSHGTWVMWSNGYC